MNLYTSTKHVAARLFKPIASNIFPYRFSAFNLTFSRFCNASCRMCVKTHYDDKDRSRVYLDQTTLTNALNQLASMGARDVNVFPMGEPLLHPHFNEYIDQIVSAGFRVVFSTNGELLKQKHHEALKKVTSIGYSIEGYDEETVRHYRGVSFSKVFNGLESLRQSIGDKPMTLRTTLYKDMDAKYLEKYMATWAKYFDELVVTPANPPHLYHLALPSGIGCSPDEFFTFQKDPAKQCTVGRAGVAILPNGDVSECTEDYSARFVFGNINQTHLREIIEGAKLARFQTMARTNVDNICGDCAAYYSLIPEHRKIADVLSQQAHMLFSKMTPKYK